MTPRDAERRRWRQVQDLFHRARELDRGERRAFLERHCAGDAQLLAEVDGLLGEELSDASASADPTQGFPLAVRQPREDLSGGELGHYRLERIVGEGSMGVIYEARQRYVERSVALKLLRRRSDVLQDGGSPQAYERMLQRFAAEAEVLGLLDHPGIVPIHEMERDGERSYFTMRLVRGDDFRDIIARVHARTQGWGLHRALGVVLRVCETMAFAHDRGVLHRDLKPSHVMVGAFGEVYIVDWGLAKLPGPGEARDIRLREEEGAWAVADATRVPAPLRTVEGDVIGTPAYMPPEQARGESGRLSVRSDVYALGALLYHLLVGHGPYLGSGEPVSARSVLARVQAGPPASVARLAPSVPGALAAICAKAMRRDPDERYASMEELARDLRAWLENRVVSAHRTGALIELWKWLQRNRVLAATLGLLCAALAGWGTSVLVIQASKSRALARAVDETARERDRSRDQAAIATATTAFLDDLFRSVHPLEAQGRTPTVREALDRATGRLVDAFPGQPLVEAAVRTTLGIAYHQLGHHDEARPHLRWAYETRLRLLGERDPATLGSLGEYGVLLRDQGAREEAEQLLRRCARSWEELLGPQARETLRARGNLCQLLFDRERYDEALELAAGLVAASQAGLASDEDLLVALEVLGSVHCRRNEFEAAEALFRRQLDVDRRVFGPEHPNTLIATTNLASTLDALGRHDEARELCIDLVQRMSTVFGLRHRNTLFATANTGILLCNQGATDEGLELLREVLVAAREELGSDSPDTLLTLYNLAEMLRRARRFADAVPLYRELLAWQRPRLDPDHGDLRRTLHGLADCLTDAQAYEEAVALLRELLPLQQRNPDGPLANASDTARQLAWCYEKLGWTEELHALREQAGLPEPVPAAPQR